MFFSFLNPADPYHAYYRHRVTKVTEGEGDDITPGPKEQEVETVVVETLKGGVVALEPPPPEFILDAPPISAVDL